MCYPYHVPCNIWYGLVVSFENLAVSLGVYGNGSQQTLYQKSLQLLGEFLLLQKMGKVLVQGSNEKGEKYWLWILLYFSLLPLALILLYCLFFSRFGLVLREFLVSSLWEHFTFKDQHLSHFTHNNKKIGLNLRSNFTLICYMLPNQLKAHDPLNEGSGNRKQIFLKSCHNITTLKRMITGFSVFNPRQPKFQQALGSFP